MNNIIKARDASVLLVVQTEKYEVLTTLDVLLILKMNNMNLCYQDNVDDLINLINFDEDSVVKEDNLFEDSSTNSIILLDKKGMSLAI